MIQTLTLEMNRKAVPVLYVVLHVEVIDEQRISQSGIADCFIEWKSWFASRSIFLNINTVITGLTKVLQYTFEQI